MNRTILTITGVILAGAVLLGLSSVFTVYEGQQALVLQFGRPVKVENTAGLKFKLPFVQNVVYYDRRLLDFDAEASEVIALDQKRMIVDAFVRYRIVDPLEFYKTVGTEAIVRQRLGAIVNSNLRNVLGGVVFSTVLTDRRGELMQTIRGLVQKESVPFGINVVDLRIRRADLPTENSQAIFARMQSEREREARQHRAEGAEDAQRIRSEAERDRTILLAEAQKKAQILRGEGDGDSVRILADAVNRDPEFFNFYRSLQAYRVVLGDGNATVVLSPDSEFLRYFREPWGGNGNR